MEFRMIHQTFCFFQIKMPKQNKTCGQFRAAIDIVCIFRPLMELVWVFLFQSLCQVSAVKFKLRYVTVDVSIKGIGA